MGVFSLGSMNTIEMQCFLRQSRLKSPSKIVPLMKTYLISDSWYLNFSLCDCPFCGLKLLYTLIILEGLLPWISIMIRFESTPSSDNCLKLINKNNVSSYTLKLVDMQTIVDSLGGYLLPSYLLQSQGDFSLCLLGINVKGVKKASSFQSSRCFKYNFRATHLSDY